MCVRKYYREIYGEHADPRIKPDGSLVDSND